MAKPIEVTTDMAKPIEVTTDMAKSGGLGDGEDGQLDTQATHRTSDHNRQIIHDRGRKVSENQTRQSNNEHQKIKGDNPQEKFRPSAKRGIQR